MSKNAISESDISAVNYIRQGRASKKSSPSSEYGVAGILASVRKKGDVVKNCLAGIIFQD